MARNEHKKVLQQLSEAYQTVQERYVMRDPDGDGSWPDDERQEEREKNPNYGEPEYEDAEEPRHLSALKRMQRDIMNGMTAKESMEGMMIHPSHMRDLLEEYLKWSEQWSEGPIETGFEDDPESSYDIEKRLGGGRFDHPGKTYRSGSPRVRLTRDSPGTSSVHLPVDDPRIQKYLDLGYKIVKDYKKAEQDEEDKDFDDEQRDQDPFRHDEDNQVFGLVDASGKIVSLYDNEGIMRQVMEGRPDLKVVPLDELPFNAEI